MFDIDHSAGEPGPNPVCMTPSLAEIVPLLADNSSHSSR
jgi:hypothetical protein